MDIYLYWANFLAIFLICLINPGSPEVSGGVENRDQVIGHNVQGTAPYDSHSYNVTINHLSPRSVEVLWNCNGQNLQDKYEVTLKPLEASYRVIEAVPYNTCYLVMDKLDPFTKYQVQVTSISGKVRKRSSSLIFRTYPEDWELDNDDDGGDEGEESPLSKFGGEDESKDKKVSKDRLQLPRVRLVEVSLVAMALILWAGAITLFFHRWGKIRMLLPYQPDYKAMERSNSVCANCSMTPHHQCCRYHPLHVPGSSDPFGGPHPIPSTPRPRSREASAGVTLTDAQCSPIKQIRPDRNRFSRHPPRRMCDSLKGGSSCHEEGVVEMSARRSKSADELDHYTPFFEDCIIDMGCTDF